jgi:hypothetical protein
MICTDSYDETRSQYEDRIDSLLREMVVEEALGAMEDDRPPRSFSLNEIADYLGLGFATLRNVEQEALNNFKDLMINWEKDDE